MLPHQGACRVLSLFWEMVPIDTTRALLTRVVGRLASDGASPLVRLAAVEAMSVLLDCPASHGVLKSMLPVRRGRRKKGKKKKSGRGSKELGRGSSLSYIYAIHMIRSTWFWTTERLWNFHHHHHGGGGWGWGATSFFDDHIFYDRVYLMREGGGGGRFRTGEGSRSCTTPYHACVCSPLCLSSLSLSP